MGPMHTGFRTKLVVTAVVMAILLAGCENQSTSSSDCPNGNCPPGSTSTWRGPSDSADTSVGTGDNGVTGDPASRGPGDVSNQGGTVEVRGVPLYRQGGPDQHSPNGQSWRPQAYCGPTSFQMVMSYYGINKSRDYWGLTVPGTTQQVRSGSRGQMYVYNAGAVYPPMVAMAKAHGMSKSQIRNNLTIAGLKELVAQGRPQIVRIDGTIRYSDGYSRTTPGHVIVVTGVTAAGNVIVQDPATARRHEITGASFRQIWRSPKNFSVDIAR